MDKLKLLVIVPVYNEDYDVFMKCLKSIQFAIEASGLNAKILVINDDSEVHYNISFEGYNDSLIDSVMIKKSPNLYKLRTTCINKAKEYNPEFVCFIDSDDVISGNYFRSWDIVHRKYDRNIYAPNLLQESGSYERYIIPMTNIEDCFKSNIRSLTGWIIRYGAFKDINLIRHKINWGEDRLLLTYITLYDGCIVPFDGIYKYNHKNGNTRIKEKDDSVVYQEMIKIYDKFGRVDKLSQYFRSIEDSNIVVISTDYLIDVYDLIIYLQKAGNYIVHAYYKIKDPESLLIFLNKPIQLYRTDDIDKSIEGLRSYYKSLGVNITKNNFKHIKVSAGL